MRFVGLTLLGVWLFTTASAQFYFNRRETLHSTTVVLGSVLESNGRYYCLSRQVIDSINYAGNGLFYTRFGLNFSVWDEQGKILRDTIYQKAGRNLEQAKTSWCRLADKNFLIAIDDADTTIYHLLLIKMDSLGHVIWEREYDRSFCSAANGHDFWQLIDFQSDRHGSWLLLSTIVCDPTYPGGYNKMLLTKLDSSFNVVWNKDFGDNVHNSIAGRLLVDSNCYYVCGGKSDAAYVVKNHLTAEIFKTDTAGNIMWHWLSDSTKLIFRTEDIIRTKDGGYVYCGLRGAYEVLQSNGSYSDVYWLPWIEKLDSNRDVQWNLMVPGIPGRGLLSDLTKVVELPNGDIVASGFLWEPTANGDTVEGNSGILMRLSSNGTLKWMHRYRTPQNDTFQYGFYDMRHTSDGGFIMAGEATDDIDPYELPPQRAWLVKVDSNGCQGYNDPQCWPVAVSHAPQVSQSKYEVYPNPASAQLNISFRKVGNCVQIFELTDVTGRILREVVLGGIAGHATLDIGDLQSGIYVYRILENGLVIAAGKVLKG